MCYTLALLSNTVKLSPFYCVDKHDRHKRRDGSGLHAPIKFTEGHLAKFAARGVLPLLQFSLVGCTTRVAQPVVGNAASVFNPTYCQVATDFRKDSVVSQPTFTCNIHSQLAGDANPAGVSCPRPHVPRNRSFTVAEQHSLEQVVSGIGN